MLLFSVILMLSNFVNAEIIVDKYKIEDDFILSSNNAVIKTCACSTFLDIVSVKNTGTHIATYIISSDTKYVSLYPNTFTLKPSQEIRLLSYIGVPCGSDGFDFNIKVSSDKGLEKVMRQKVEAEKCQNLLLSPIIDEASVEPCRNATYSFLINNTDGFTETYSFSLDAFSEYALFTENPVVVESMQSKQVSFVIKPDCGYNGLFNLTLKAEAKYSDYKAVMPLTLDIAPKYDFSLSGSEEIDACVNDKKEIEYKILNLADFENEYILSVEDPNWVKLSANKFSLEPDQEGAFNLEIEPAKTGSFDVRIMAKSKLGSLEAVKDITVIVKDCYDFKIYFVEDQICKDDDKITIILENNGNYDENFELSLLAPDFIKLDREFIAVDAHDSEEIQVNVGEDGKYNSYYLEVTARIPGKNFVEKTGVDLDIMPLKKCYRPLLKPTIKFVDYSENEIEFILSNEGLKNDRYEVSTVKPDWVKFDDKNFYVGVDESVDFSIGSEPTGDIKGGAYKVIFNIASEKGEYTYQKNFYLIISNNNIIGRALGKIYNCRFILLTLGIILLVLIILFIIFSVKWKKTRREKRKRFSIGLKWVIPLIIIFLIISAVALFLCLGLKLPTIKTEQTVKEEVIVEEEPEVVEEGFNCENYEGENICDSALYKKIEKNGALEIDLAGYFFDPDGDPLVYKSSNPDHIEIIIDGSKAKLVPEQDWTGYEEVVFTATDPDDNMVVSDIFLINVFESEKNFWQRLFS